MRASTFLTVIPAVAVAGVVAVANREAVRFSLDPFSADNPVFSLDIPLFLLVFLAVLFGVVLGGFTVWLRRTPASRPSQSRALGIRD